LQPRARKLRAPVTWPKGATSINSNKSEVRTWTIQHPIKSLKATTNLKLFLPIRTCSNSPPCCQVLPSAGRMSIPALIRKHMSSLEWSAAPEIHGAVDYADVTPSYLCTLFSVFFL
jgi:hypothetical protein